MRYLRVSVDSEGNALLKDSEIRRINAEDVLLIEGTHGTGHLVRSVEGQERRARSCHYAEVYSTSRYPMTRSTPNLTMSGNGPFSPSGTHLCTILKDMSAGRLAHDPNLSDKARAWLEAQQDPSSDEALINHPKFSFCAAHVVTTGRVPVT